MAILNHIGIAVEDLPRMKQLFALLNLSIQNTEDVPDQGVKTHFLPLPIEQVQLELLEPMNPSGPVAQFLQKKGPGIHHLAFTVRKGELDALCQTLRTEGFQLIYEQPRPGAHGMRVNFIHPKTSGGILIEVMEPG